MIRRIVLDSADLAHLRLFIINLTAILLESAGDDPDREHQEWILRLAQRILGDVQ